MTNSREKLQRNPSKISIPMKNKTPSSLPKNLQSIKPFWLLNCHYRKHGITFLEESQSLPAATAADLEMPCLCLTAQFAKAVPICQTIATLHPQELGHWLWSQNLRLSSEIARQGLKFRLTLGFSMPLGNFNQILIVENLTKFSTSRGLTIFPEPPLA